VPCINLRNITEFFKLKQSTFGKFELKIIYRFSKTVYQIVVVDSVDTVHELALDCK